MACVRGLSRLSASVAVVLSVMVPVVAGTGGPASAVTGASTVTRGTFGYGTVQLVPPSGTTAPADCTSPASTPRLTEYDCTPDDAGSFDWCTTNTSSTSSTTTCDVHVQASAPAGWAFDHWSGDCSGTSPTCSVFTSEHDCDTSGLKPVCSDVQNDVSTIANFDDTRAPTTTLTQAPAANSVVYSDTQSQPFTFNTNEDAEAPNFACKKDTGTFSACSSGFTWSSIADGIHDFCVHATDPSGLQGGDACRHWEQETNPTATIMTKPASATAAPSATFTYSSNKASHPADGSTLSYECQLDSDTMAPCPASGKSYSGLANGDHTFTVSAIFTAALGGGAHTSPVASYTWSQDDPDLRVVDVTGPSGVVISNTQAQSISWAQHTPGESLTYTCGLDDATPAPCSSPTDLTSLADGVHTFHITATDAANATTTNVTWDQEIPATAVIDSGRASGSTTTSRSATFTFHSPKANVTFECRVDRQAWRACSGAAIDSISGLSYSRHTWSLRARFVAPIDGSVHYGPTVSRTWTVLSAVRIASVRYDSAGRDNRTNKSLNGEWVKIVNHKSTRVRLRGWTLRDSDGNVYRFPTFTLKPGAAVRVHTGKGRNSATDLYWGRRNYVWDNRADSARLRSSSGLTLSTCRWTRIGTGSITC